MNYTLNKHEWFNSFFLALGYFVVFFICKYFFIYAGIESGEINNNTLMQWDAGIYEDIMRNGYSYKDVRYNNTGQFPLFPWLWSMLHVGIMGICVVNVFLFSAGFAVLCCIFPVEMKVKILWLSTPSLYFVTVPYTEALSFLLTVFCFLGVVSSRRWLIWCSLFLLSLTRATTIFLIPAFLLMELVTNDRKNCIISLKNYATSFAFPILSGLSLFVLYQYQKVGIWFVYFKQQSRWLGHEWAIPKLPFQNYLTNFKTLWLSGLALLVCVLAFVFVIHLLFRWLVDNKISGNKLLVLSLTYLSVVMFSVLFCSPTWGEKGTTNLFGLNRYTLCTPFIFVFLYYYANSKEGYGALKIAAVILLSNFLWLAFGAYVHIQIVIFWNFVTLIVLLYMLNSKKYEWVNYCLIAVNVTIQFFLYHQFITGLYPD